MGIRRLVAAGVLTLALAACASSTADTSEAASAPDSATPTEEATSAEPTEEATTEEPTPLEPWIDDRGYVDRTDTWAEFDERAVEVAQIDGVDTTAAVDAFLDFLYTNVEDEHAFQPYTAEDLANLIRDNCDDCSDLEAQWYYNESVAEASARGLPADHHHSILHLFSTSAMSGRGFHPGGEHDLAFKTVQATVEESYEHWHADGGGPVPVPLAGPGTVAVSVWFDGEIHGTTDAGEPHSIRFPFPKITGVVTPDADGVWKVILTNRF